MGISTPMTLSSQRIIVPVGGMETSANKNVIMSTYALGTCVAVILYDAGFFRGGLIHFMLPDSTLSSEKAEENPGMFADTGLLELMESMKSLGTSPSSLKVMITGGATTMSKGDSFNIGDKNISAAQKILKDLDFSVKIEDTGGVCNRTIHFSLASGEVVVKTSTGNKTFSLK